MNPMGTARGRAVVMQPGEGRSWWQPTPANGHADPKLVPSDTGFGTLSMGYQTIAPTCCAFRRLMGPMTRR